MGLRASRRMRTSTVWPSCFETHRSAPRRWERLCSHLRRDAPQHEGAGARRISQAKRQRGREEQTSGCGKNDRWSALPVSGLLFTGNAATPTCRAVSARGDSDHAWAVLAHAERGRQPTTISQRGHFGQTMPGGKSAVTIRPGARPGRSSVRRGSSAQLVTRASRNDVAVDADAQSVVVLVLDLVERGRLGCAGQVSKGHGVPGRC